MARIALLGLTVAASLVASHGAVVDLMPWVRSSLGPKLREVIDAAPAGRPTASSLLGAIAAGTREAVQSLIPLVRPAASRGLGSAPAAPPDLPGAEYGFIPEFDGALALPGLTPTYGANVPRPAPQSSLNLNTRCFQSMTATATAAGTDPKTGSPSFTISFRTGGGNSSCDDVYVVGAANTFQIVVMDKVGVQNVTFVNVDQPSGAAEWVAREGVRIFRFYGGVLDMLEDVLSTVSLFVPSLTTGPQLDANSMKLNRDFIQQYANLVTNDRPAEYLVTGMDPSDILNGDLLAIHRADGLGTLEEFGTGEATTHIAVAVRLGPEQDLFVVESTDRTSYWPNPNIQKTAWDEWTTLALACNYTVTILRLRPEIRATWNQSAAEDWIAYSIGYPYGYHNFLWTFMDVPGGNLPVPADWHLIEVVFRVIEDVVPSVPQTFVIWAMNFRLTGGQTWNASSTLTEVYNNAARAGMTFGDLMAMPEQDGWMYPDGPSYVCDAYACALYKAAGLFRAAGVPDDELNCVEFTNFDMYSLNFYESDPSSRPAACQQADPSLPYCIYMGSYTIDLKGFNTINPYSHMGEKCSSQWPDYKRPAHC